MRLGSRDLGPVTPMPLGTAVVAVGGNALTRADQRGAAEEIAANAAEAAGGPRPARAQRPLGRGRARQRTAGRQPGPSAGRPGRTTGACAAAAPALGHDAGAAGGRPRPGDRRRVRRRRGGLRWSPTCLVDPADPAFAAPVQADRTVPVEPAEADRAGPRPRLAVVEDAGRGYRRVVPSPRADRRGGARRGAQPARRPVTSCSPRAAAASPVPARRTGGSTHSTRSSTRTWPPRRIATAARGPRSCYLLTGVDCVLLDHGTPQRAAGAPARSADEAERYLAAGQFPPGSMGPKIAAALALPARRRAPRHHHLRRDCWRAHARRPARRRHPHRARHRVPWRARVTRPRAAGAPGHVPRLAAAHGDHR